jgi:RNA polymerase sigma factor (TIGR02999 family)
MFVPSGEILSDLYGELHRLASSFLRNERPNHTLQPSALINEAYLRMAIHRTHAAADRPHFLRLAARAMRQVLIDHGRGRRAQKRLAVPGADAEPLDGLPMEDYLTINTALEKLEAFDPQLASIIELRFFAGLSIPETAEAMSMSEATVKREWAVARAWLRAEFGMAEAG